jgi:hypothetical protein
MVLAREPNLEIGCPRRRVSAVPADDRAGRCESTDDEDRSDDEVRSAGRPDQERSGEHVANQACT